MYRAAWYLATNRIMLWPWSAAWGPIVLGLALALVVVATVILSPSTDSRFIYTDF